MKIDVDIASPTQRKIHVELPGDAVDQEFGLAYEHLSRRARIKGFRPGKVPRAVLQRLYGDEVKGRVLSRLVEQSLADVFKERGLKVVSSPEVEADTLEEGKTFTFSALVEVRPEIEVKSYTGLELEMIKFSVNEAQVAMALRRLQDAHAQLAPVEERQVVKRGDFVTLDFVGAIDGKPFPGGKGENYLLEVGGENALPQFEEAVVGLKKDQEANITVPYPEDHLNRELAGKAVTFSVTVREIKKKIQPPLDDEFAKDHGECTSLDELKQKIRSRLESELRQMQKRELKEQLVDRIIEAHSFDIPQAMVEGQIRYLLERHQRGQRAQGSIPSEEKPSLEDLRKELEPHARRQVQAMLLIEKIAECEKIDVAEEELQRRIEESARAAGDQAAAVRQIYARGEAREHLRSQMVTDRTLDFLLERAKVKEVEPPVDAREKKG